MTNMDIYWQSVRWRTRTSRTFCPKCVPISSVSASPTRERSRFRGSSPRGTDDPHIGPFSCLRDGLFSGLFQPHLRQPLTRSRRLMLVRIHVKTIQAKRKLKISPINETNATSEAKLPMIANTLKKIKKHRPGIVDRPGLRMAGHLTELREGYAVSGNGGGRGVKQRRRQGAAYGNDKENLGPLHQSGPGCTGCSRLPQILVRPPHHRPGRPRSH